MPHGSLNTFTGCKLKYLYKSRHTGLLWWLGLHPTSCILRSEWITANTGCKNDLHACMFLFCKYRHMHAQAYTSPRYPSTVEGLGECCPLNGDSLVRLHLARTHQQGHKVNIRQPLNLVQPDKGATMKTEFVLIQIQGGR